MMLTYNILVSVTVLYCYFCQNLACGPGWQNEDCKRSIGSMSNIYNIQVSFLCLPRVYSEPSRTSKIELFAKKANSRKHVCYHLAFSKKIFKLHSDTKTAKHSYF